MNIEKFTDYMMIIAHEGLKDFIVDWFNNLNNDDQLIVILSIIRMIKKLDISPFENKEKAFFYLEDSCHTFITLNEKYHN